MADAARQLDEAYFLGWDACRQGSDRDQNPYAAEMAESGADFEPVCLLMARAWWRGWDQQAADGVGPEFQPWASSAGATNRAQR